MKAVAPTCAAIIPARYASTRLPAKPLLRLDGKTMIQRTYEQALRATMVQSVIVATDDERIAAVVREFGGRALMTPPELPSGTDRVAYASEVLRRQGDQFECVINVQGDEPAIHPEMIDHVVNLLAEEPSAQMATLVKRIDKEEELFTPSVVKVVVDANAYALYFSRSPIPFARDAVTNAKWLKSGTFYKHFGIYGFRTEFLRLYPTLTPSPIEILERLEQLRALYHGHKIKVGITEYDSKAIDTPEDVDRFLQELRKS